MKVTITHNTAKNGIEVRFTEKPDDFIRDWLKACKFRYSRAQNLWYMRYSVALMGNVCAFFKTQYEVQDGSAVGSVPAAPGPTREDLGVEAAS